MHRRPARALALTLLTASALSACGLKQDVKDQLTTSGQLNGTSGGVVDGSTGSVDGSTSGATGTTGVGGTGTSGTTGVGGTGTSGASGTSGTSGATSGSTGASGTSTSGSSGTVPTGGTTTGIDFKNKVVKIALHGPLTGAGVPQESFNSGPPKFWRNHKLANGFSVDPDSIDDKYNAADASRACRAAADKYFLIIGGAGTDQISACAQDGKLRRLNVPYLSSGVTEAGLGNIPTYTATSLTYKQQAPLLIKLAKDKGYFGGKWAMVITETENFRDAREAMIAQLKAAGAQGTSGAFNPSKDVFLTAKAPSNCGTLAGQLRGGGYNVIYFLGQPSFFAQCVGAVGNVPINPTYTGPGPSFGINSVINLACKANPQYKAFYLNPSPSHNQRQKYGAPSDLTDDIELGIWGAMQQLKQAFDRVQGPLTRESFIAANQNVSLPGGVLRPVVLTGQNRFGGTGAYANAAICGATGISDTVGVYNK